MDSQNNSDTTAWRSHAWTGYPGGRAAVCQMCGALRSPTGQVWRDRALISVSAECPGRADGSPSDLRDIEGVIIKGPLS